MINIRDQYLRVCGLGARSQTFTHAGRNNQFLTLRDSTPLQLDSFDVNCSELHQDDMSGHTVQGPSLVGGIYSPPGIPTTEADALQSSIPKASNQILPEAALKNPFLKVVFHGDLAACESEPVCAMLALILHLATY